MFLFSGPIGAMIGKETWVNVLTFFVVQNALFMQLIKIMRWLECQAKE